MDAVLLGLLILLLVLAYWKGWGRYRSAGTRFLLLISLSMTWTDTVMAEQNQPDTFDERDTRVFKAVACTKDSKPVEALYYIVASRADLSAGKPSPSAQLMRDEVQNNWRRITSQLTMEQIIEERFADTYHALLTEMIRHLQQAVEEKGDVSIAVSEINSRPMDKAKDQDIPACSELSG
ncbi:MAG: hypothetical protein ACXW34_04705 [Nitrospira sp.]